MRKPLNNEWHGILQHAASIAHAHTVPIYTFHESELKLNRTGVLYRVANHKFILTAAHHLQEYCENSIALCFACSKANDLPIPLVDSIFHFTETEGTSTVRDIAAIKLTEKAATQIPDYWRFLTLPDLGTESRLDEGFYLAFGFPEQGFKMEAWSNPTPLPFLSEAIVPQNVEVFHPDIHIALSFDRDAVHLDSEMKSSDGIRLPKIQGMSGCGIWKVVPRRLRLDEWKPEKMRLVGIQHRCKHDECLIATQIKWVLQRLASDYPEVKTAASLYYREGY